jgi:hypothetical protein
MDTSKDIKGQEAIRAFFGINMSKNENPSKQNDILVSSLKVYIKIGQNRKKTNKNKRRDLHKDCVSF